MALLRYRIKTNGIKYQVQFTEQHWWSRFLPLWMNVLEFGESFPKEFDTSEEAVEFIVQDREYFAQKDREKKWKVIWTEQQKLLRGSNGAGLLDD